MSPMGPSVGNGYRGRRGDATGGLRTIGGNFWDPLVRDYGPANVFNEEEIDTTTAKVGGPSPPPQRQRHDRNYRDKNNNKKEENNNNEDRRNDDPRQSNNKSNRELSRQQRGSRWAQSNADKKFRDQSKQFDRGSSKYKKNSTPTNEQLLTFVNKRSRKKRCKTSTRQIEATATEICNRKSKAGQKVRELVHDYLNDGRYGNVPKVKPDDCVRLFLGQFNIVSVFFRA